MYLLAFFTILLCALQCRGKCTVQVRGVNATSIQTILDKHNELRAKVANGEQENLPQAANMLQMGWDDTVAQKAQEWADTCRCENNEYWERDTSRGYTGQNIAYVSNEDPNPDWNGIIQSFYDEVSEFDPKTIDKYGYDDPNSDKSYVFDSKTAHFTQVIWANSNKIGCGYVRYQKDEKYFHLYVLDYLPGGNIIMAPIYKKGEPCSKCGGCGSIAGLCEGT